MLVQVIGRGGEIIDFLPQLTECPVPLLEFLNKSFQKVVLPLNLYFFQHYHSHFFA